MEGACYILVFDIMQDKDANQHNLGWIRSALQCLRSMLQRHGGITAQVPTTIVTIERMVRSVFPEFVAEDTGSFDENSGRHQPDLDGGAMTIVPGSSNPAMPDETLVSGQNQEPDARGEELVDFTAADIGLLNFDFGTMDMDAFLSIDPSQDWDLRW